MSNLIGKTILHYKIIEELGRGGMGVVYKAEDTKLKREVAIKFLPHHIQADDEERERMKIEAQAAAALNHPNIATVHSIEETADELFIVMEYIEGKELKDLIPPILPLGKGGTASPPPLEKGNRGGFLPIDDVLDYATQIADGLHAAHEKGIIHRDIKSSNIMVTTRGQAKIMDFGLAKVSGNPQLTKIGTTIGTTAYMSPEQVRGEVVDQRSDIWSYGVLLYELLTGQLPYTGPYEQAIMYSIVNEEPIPVSQVKEDLPASLVTIVAKCMEKDVQKRYQTFSELLTDLKEAETNLGVVPHRKKIKPTKTPAAQPRLGVPLMISAAIGLILILVFLFPTITDWFKSSIVPSQQHLLVLPLTNISSDPTKQVFCDGLVEILTSKLSQLEQFHGSLWVVPASEVRRQGINSASEAQQSFGVNLVVSGSLQSFNDQIRLTLNLIDAEDLRQLNSAVLDITPEKLSALQDEAAVKMLAMLNLELNPQIEKVLTAGGTTVPGANEFYLQGRGYLQRYEDVGNIDASIKLFENAIKQDPKFALALAGLGEAYWRKYEATKNAMWVEKAQEQCQQAMKLNNQLAAVNITLGVVNNGTGKYEDAVNDFEKALDSDPTNADAYRGLAKAYEALGSPEKSESTFQQAIKLKTDYWAGYNDLGVFYFRQGRYDDAIAQFQQVIVHTPDNYRGYNNLGGIYYLLQRWQEAQQMFERSFALKKSYAVSSNLGTLYFIQGKYSDAARTYEKGLELNPNEYIIWGNLASAYYWAPGERDKAPETYRQAIALVKERLKINPNDPDLIAMMAGYYSMIDERPQSLQLIEQALEMAQENVQVMYRAGTVYEQLGDRDKALYWIDKSLENGYSLAEIEHQPDLRQLLKDARFQRLVKKYANTYGRKEN